MADDKKVNTQDSQSSLEDFKWDEENTFFGIKPEGDVQEAFQAVASNKVKADDDPIDAPIDNDEDEDDDSTDVKPSVKSENKKEEDEPEPFSEKDTGDKKDDESTEGSEGFYTTLASELKEKGIFQNVELPEGEDIDEEKFFELQDAEVEARVTETFEAFFEEMDEDAKAFLQFKKNGGRTQDFFQVYGSQLSIEEIDIEKEEDQDKVISHYLRVIDKMDNDEVTDRLEWLGDNGRKKAYAEKYQAKLKEIDGMRKQQIVKAAEENIEARTKANDKFKSELNEILEKTEEVGDFKFTKDDKKELVNYITKPTIKVGKNKFITPFMSELGIMFKGEGDEKKNLLLLAKLVKSKFDVKDLLTKAKTKVVQDAKSKLQSAKQGIKPSTSGTYTKKTLADFF